MSEISVWLDGLGLLKYAPAFESNEIDLEILPELTEADLSDLGLPLGPRRKVMLSVEKLRDESQFPSTSSATNAYIPQMPAGLIQKGLASSKALVGELKLVTILFADIKGSTELVASRGAEEADELMTPALNAMIDAVHQYEGTVNRVQGDGLMAMFGAPIAHEDHVVRACGAALAIQSSNTTGEMKYRVGLHSGEVVVRSIGNDLSLNYDAVGQTAHLAARMEQIATPGEILMTNAAYDLAKGQIEVTAMGERAVKGFDGSIEAYRLDAINESVSRFDVSRDRGLGAFVGRKAEIDVLHRERALASDGEFRVVHLVGDPGIGKSRLLHELQVSSTDDGVWNEGRSLSYGSNMALHPIRDLLRRDLGVGETDSHADIHVKIAQRCAALGEHLSEHEPYLRYFLGIDPGDAEVTELESKLRRVAVFDAISALYIASASTTLVTLVLEDLHWVDSATEDFIDHFTENSPSDCNVLLLLTSRPEYGKQRNHLENFTRLEIKSLTTVDGLKLVQALVADSTLVASVQNRIVGIGEGNPLFLEEVSTTIREAAGLGADHSETLDLESLDIPDSLQGVIAARIDRLDSIEKEAVYAASTIGREFSTHLLYNVCPGLEGQPAVLPRLCSLELLQEQTGNTDRGYRFKHALVQEVAQKALLSRDRRELHGRIGAAIEHINIDHIAEHYNVLAWHFEQARQANKAVDYLDKAGKSAMEAFALPDALELYQRALNLCNGEDVEDAHEKIVQLHKVRAGMFFARGRFGSAREEWAKLVDYAKRSGDQLTEVSALSGIAFATQWDLDFDSAEQFADEAIALSLATGTEDSSVAARLSLGYMSTVSGDLVNGKKQLDVAKAIGDKTGDVGVSVASRFLLSMSEGWQGRVDSHLEIAEEALELARSKKVLPLLIRAQWTTGIGLILSGQYDKAKATLTEASEFANRLGDLAMAPRIINTLGWLHGRCGDPEGGIELCLIGLDAAYEFDHAIGVEMQTYARINWADALCSQDNVEDAREVYAEAYSVAANPKTHVWMKWRYSLHLMVSLADFSLNQGKISEAEDYLSNAIDVATATKSQKYLADIARLRSWIAATRNQPDEAFKQALQANQFAILSSDPLTQYHTSKFVAKTLHAHAHPSEAADLEQNAERIAAQLIHATQDPVLQSALTTSLRADLA